MDLPLIGAALGLMTIGLLTVYSATTVPGMHEGLWIKQLLWALVAVAAGWLIAMLPYRVWDALALPAFGLSLVLLVLVLLVGSSAYGAKRWLDLGPIKFQPSEFAKIAVILVLARRFSDPKIDLRRIQHWLPAALLVMIPFVFVLRQPDLGTSLAFPAILIFMIFWGGMPPGHLFLGLSPVLNVVLFFATGSLWWFAGVFVAGLAILRPRISVLLLFVALNGVVALAMPNIWNGLADYQQRRIQTFLDPNNDPHGAGYQVIQSKIAIGSGGVVGRGFLKGTQKGLAFLPMRHTDFVYSVVGEEFGLVGAVTVVILYAVLVLRGFRIALACRDRFASLMIVGVVAAFFYHVMVNMLMTIGWAPVTGLPLPLMSYGGTALIANGIEIGLIQGAALRRRGG